MTTTFRLSVEHGVGILRLESSDGINRLSSECVMSLSGAIQRLALEPRPLVVAGNEAFFAAGADLEEIVALYGPAAHAFAHMGQSLMQMIDEFPAPVCAAISGYCMGGGLDLALACDYRIASPKAVFGHRGAALGLITGWGGTQRLPRLIGKARALEILITAEKLTAAQALRHGLIDAIADDPVAKALRRIKDGTDPKPAN